MSLLYFPSKTEPIIHIHKCNVCGAHIDVHYHGGTPLPCGEVDARELCVYCIEDEYEEVPEHTPQNCGVEI